MFCWHFLKLTIIVTFLSLLSSCQLLKHHSEIYYIKKAKDVIKRDIPQSILIQCQYKDVSDPTILSHEISPFQDVGIRSYYDSKTKTIYYEEDHIEDIAHEFYHHLSQELDFNALCHEQMAASLLKALITQEHLYQKHLLAK